MWFYHLDCAVHGLNSECRAWLLESAHQDSKGYSDTLEIIDRRSGIRYDYALAPTNGVSYIRGASTCAHCGKSFKGHRAGFLKRFTRHHY